MPYRRLPNTDQARIRAMKEAVKTLSKEAFNENVVSFKTKNEVQSFLFRFEQRKMFFKQSWDNQVESNKLYQQVLNNARMHISHFIQVLNLAVIRGEIKKEHKEYYQLDLDTHNVPDLTTENNILIWGKNVIEGENNRLRKEGGTPIYNPTIAKLQVHYEKFKEHRNNQKLYKSTTERNREELIKLREQADALILDIWNQVENHFKKVETNVEEQIKKCSEYGVKYYYRKNEVKPQN